MDKQELRITAVEYLNTVLFVEGLKESWEGKSFVLSLDNPAECARKMKNGEADIGLVPVAEIPHLSPSFVFSDYCIGASGPVKSVLLCAHKPLHELKSVVLDPHSRTSVKLLGILCKEYWKKDLLFSVGEAGFETKDYSLDTGILVIGDKAFSVENEYEFSYDLAAEWIKFTGQHFVFAAWVSRIDLDKNIIDEFNSALKRGLSQKDRILEGGKLQQQFEHVDLREYLTNNISYSFDERKKTGMALFLKKTASLMRSGSINEL